MALTDNLVAYWSLDEASGNAVDAHSTNDLTETDGTIASTTGKVGNCRDFEAGDTEYFAIAENAEMGVADDDFSFALWVNAETLANFPVVLRKRLDATATNSYVLFYETAASRLYWTVVGPGPTPSDAIWGSALFTATWYFVVCWHDATNDVIGISVNDGTPVTDPHAVGASASTGEFSLGGAANQSLYWDGLIDEVGFWHRVLSGAEITELYNAGSGRDYAYISGGGGGGGVIPAASTYYRMMGMR